MSRSFDVVVTSETGETVLQTAAGWLQGGKRVLVVLGDGDAGTVRRLRARILRQAAGAGGRLTVTGNAEIACVAESHRVEAVVIRRKRTGQLIAVNAAAIVRTGARAIWPEGD